MESGGETVREADAFDIEVANEEFQLLLERDFLCARVFQRETEKVSSAR